MLDAKLGTTLKPSSRAVGCALQRLRYGVLCLLGSAMLPVLALADCSEYAGLATINEVNKERSNGRDNASDFVEIKLLDTSISSSVYGAWTMTIQEDGGDGPATFPLSGFDNTTPPWLVQVGNDISIYIDFDQGLNVILKDGAGDVIDFLDYDTTDGLNLLAAESCASLPYDTTIASSSGGVKRIGRQPDGIGDWETITAQSIDATEGETNDPVPSGAPDASMLSVFVVPGSAAEFTVTLSAASGSAIDIVYQTQDGTAVAPGDYTNTTGTLTIPAGQTSGTILIDTNVAASVDEVFRLLITSSDAVVQTTLATATFLVGGGGGVDYFVWTHDGAGINCVTENITLSAYDSAGNLVQDYAEEVTLSTQSGKGTWTNATGNGAFSDVTTNDGLAAYTFATADNGVASFNLSYQEGAASVDLYAYQTDTIALRDNDAAPPLVFSPSGFTFTPLELPRPPTTPISDTMPTQTAGLDFDLHLAAYGQTADDPVCGIIEAYTGVKSISFWFDYENPDSGGIAPTANVPAMAVDETLSVAQSVTFSDGQASVAVKYKDVGQIQLHGKDGAIAGATNLFVVKPADIVIVDVENSAGVNNPAATDAIGLGANGIDPGGFVAAGERFAVTLEVRDAEGSLTPNYGNETPKQTLQIASSMLVLPAGGSNPLINNGVIIDDNRFPDKLAPGRFYGNTFAWEEYGIIKLTASIGGGSYLGTSNVIGTESGNVGRFYPADFFLDISSTAAACNNFTYMNQSALTIEFTLQARSMLPTALPTTLQNYHQGYGDIGAAGLASIVYHAEDNNDGVDRGVRLVTSPVTWINGVYELYTSTNQFNRDAVADGPFDALQLGLSVSGGPDSRPLFNAMNMNATTATDCVSLANCTAISIGGATRLRYGRLEVSNAFGPEIEPLDVALKASYFSGGGFVTNTDDDCTSYINTGTSLSNYQDGLPVVTVTSPVAANLLVDGTSAVGVALMISAPGATNTGSVDVTYDAPAWLKFDWAGTGVDQDPVGTASFGQFRGHDRIIYWREVY